jgi:hypothetical protein
VAGLDRVADAAVGAGHRCPVCAHRLLLADLAQVEVVLQQLPQQLPAAQLQQLLQLGMPSPAAGSAPSSTVRAANAVRDAANGSVASVAAQGGIGASPVGRPRS